MIVMRNMDHLLEMELEEDWIAAAHVCACNPRRLPHYPEDWYVFQVRTPGLYTDSSIRKPENCAHTAVKYPTADPPAITATSPRPYSQLNSGTVVLHPSSEVMQQITDFISTSPRIASYSFPDQDLLSDFFQGRWKPLSWRYNALKTLRIVHPQLWQDDEVHCLHYILHDKPWNQPRGTGGDYEEVNSWWWDRYEAIGRGMEASDPQGWKLVDAYVARG